MKRLLAVLLCAALLLGCLPGAAALETETDAENEIYVIEADSAKGDTRHTVHNALDQLSYTEGYRVIVRLRGSFEGQLCIPDFASPDGETYMDVTVEGVGDHPTLTGGIQKERGVCEVKELTLIGAGKEDERWGEDEPYNTGLYGGGSFKVRDCTLQEFYCGIEWCGERLVVEDCTFLECGTGILVNSDDRIRESALTGNTFRENELAVHIQESSRMGAAWLINRNRFIDNAMEVRNDTKTRFFFAASYAERGKEPNVVRCSNGFLSVYPYANSDLSVYEYATNQDIFVAEMQSEYGTMDEEMAAVYHVPADALDGLTFWTVDDDDNRSVILAFPAAQTISEEEKTEEQVYFNPFVGKNVRVSDTEMAVELYVNELPSGKVPTVTIETDEDWEDVTLTWKADENGTAEELSAPTVNGREISFSAVQGGGIYTLQMPLANGGGNDTPYQGEPVTEDQVFEAQSAYDLVRTGPMPFLCDLDGNGVAELYFMAPVMWDGWTTIGPTKSVSMPVEGQGLTIAAAFFSMDVHGNYIPVDDETSVALHGCFENLTVNLYAMNLGAYYPVQEPVWEDCPYPVAKTYRFNQKNSGFWILQTEGLLEGEPFSARMIFQGSWMGEEETLDFWFYSADDEEFAQDLLDNLIPVEGKQPVIHLPAGELDWDLTIPDTVEKLVIYGADRNENGENTTVLKGSITANNTWLDLHLLTMQGDGTGTDTGISGSARVSYMGCVFEDYGTAIHTTAFTLDGVSTVFRNNGVAIVIDTETVVGAGNMHFCEFRDNLVGIHFKRFPADRSVSGSYYFFRSVFADNLFDVWNSLGRSIFLPMTYFEQGGNASRVAAYNGQTMPTGKARSGGNSMVYDYPVATDSTFSNFDYSDAEPVLSSGLSYQIPVDALSGKNFVLMDENSVVAEISFENNADAMEPMLSMMAGTEEETFDPQLLITELSDGTVAVTMGRVPEGKQAVVSVDCGDQWQFARVRDLQENLQAGVRQNGMITFRSDSGGGYLLDPCSQIMQAAYNAEGKLLEVVCSADGTFRGMTVPDGTARTQWFFLDEAFAPID